jgi:hypothetical protein
MTQEKTEEKVEETPVVKAASTERFVTWAVTNPHNGEILQKNFRESQIPMGVVFVKFLEGTPERTKSEHLLCADGSVAWTWTTQKKRFDATLRDLASGRRIYLDKESVVGDMNVLRVGFVEEKKQRAPKVAKVAKERTPRKPREEGTETKPRSTSFKGLLPEDDCESMELNFESFTEDGGTAVEVRAFSSKKRALDHAKTLGMNESDAESAVTKVDGEWTVTQN